MSVKVLFECGGCCAKAEGVEPLKREFVSLSGKSYGFGRYVNTNPEDVTPVGWIAFDPYTGCCYCPKCWKIIMEDNESRQ